jgi:hypothetical protein
MILKKLEIYSNYINMPWRDKLNLIKNAKVIQSD